jgi:uncharacterized membrane protein
MTTVSRRLRAGRASDAPATSAPPARTVSPDIADALETVAEIHRAHQQRCSALQRWIDVVTNRLGRPGTLIIAIMVILAWALVSWRLVGPDVDDPLFEWLSLLGTLSSLIISLVILVTQRRENEFAERRAELTLQLALLGEKKSAKVVALLEELRRDSPTVVDRVDRESEVMARSADARAVVAAFDAET